LLPLPRLKSKGRSAENELVHSKGRAAPRLATPNSHQWGIELRVAYTLLSKTLGVRVKCVFTSDAATVSRHLLRLCAKLVTVFNVIKILSLASLSLLRMRTKTGF